jgi:hypothetical protein
MVKFVVAEIEQEKKDVSTELRTESGCINSVLKVGKACAVTELEQ